MVIWTRVHLIQHSPTLDSFIPCLFPDSPGGSDGTQSSCNVETWVWSLGWEDPLEKGKATHFSTLAWRIPWTTVHGVAKSWTRLSDFHFHYITLYMLNTYYSDFSYSHCCSWIIYDQWAYVIICVHLTLFHVLNFILIQSTCVSSLLRFIWSSPDFSKSLFSFFLLSTRPPRQSISNFFEPWLLL